MDSSSSAAPLELKVFAGVPGGSGSLDGDGLSSRLDSPTAIAARTDRLAIADTDNHTIRLVELDPVRVTTIAGMPGDDGCAEGQGSDALFAWPRGVAFEAGGGILVADTGNHLLRRVSVTGEVSVRAGGGCGVNPSNPVDGNLSNARFVCPTGLAVDSLGTTYISEPCKAVIRVLDSGGLSTLSFTVSDGGSSLVCPSGLALSDDGTVLYVAEPCTRSIQSINLAAQEISSYAILDSPAEPLGIAVTPGGVFVASSSNEILQAVPQSKLSGEGSTGWRDGAAMQTLWNRPAGIAYHPGRSSLFVVEEENDTVREVKLVDGNVTTTAGRPDQHGLQAASPVIMDQPRGMTAKDGILYVADRGNSSVRTLDPARPQTATTYANGLKPWDIDFAADGSLWATGGVHHVIYRIDVQRNVAIVAGAYDVPGHSNAPGEERFDDPRGIATEISGMVGIADEGNDILRGRSPDGGFWDLVPTGTSFTSPADLVVGPDGNLYVAAGSRIIRIHPDQRAEVYAGSLSGTSGALDGYRLDARFDNIEGLTFAPDGTLYVADRGNHAVRRITPDGGVDTYAGQPLDRPARAGIREGPLADSALNSPNSVQWLDGRLFITCPDENTVLVVE